MTTKPNRHTRRAEAAHKIKQLRQNTAVSHRRLENYRLLQEVMEEQKAKGADKLAAHLGKVMLQKLFKRDIAPAEFKQKVLNTVLRVEYGVEVIDETSDQTAEQHDGDSDAD